MFEVVAVHDREDGRASVGRRDVAVKRVVVAGVLRREFVSRRNQHLDDELVIDVHVEVGERVTSLRVGGGRGDLIAEAIEQIHGHVFEAELSHVLQAIAVAIVEDEVADVRQSAGREFADIGRGRGRFSVADIVRGHDEEFVRRSRISFPQSFRQRRVLHPDSEFAAILADEHIERRDAGRAGSIRVGGIGAGPADQEARVVDQTANRIDLADRG